MRHPCGATIHGAPRRRVRGRGVGVALAAVLAMSQAAAFDGALAAGPALWGDLPAGPYGVGFEVLERTDATRPLDSGAPRPLQVSVWYPTTGVEGPRLPYRDYVWLMTTELDFTPSASGPDSNRWDEIVDPYLDRIEESGVPRSAIDAWLDTPTAAVRDAKPADGTFPLIVVAQGNTHSVHNQSILCEFLASHGYVLASTPSQGRITRPPRRVEDVLPSAEEQAGDIDAVVGMSEELPCDGRRELGLIGYSFGARSAFLYQVKHGAARAMVSLDGGIANVLGKGVLETAPYFAPGKFSIPLLHLYQSGDEAVQPDFDLIDSLTRSDRTLIELAGMRHGLFASMGRVATIVPGFETVLPEGADIRSAWTAEAMNTLWFFDVVLKGEDSERSLLWPDEDRTGGPSEPGAPVILSRKRLPPAP